MDLSDSFNKVSIQPSPSLHQRPSKKKAPPKHQKKTTKAEIMKAFETAQTAAEVLKVLEDMEKDSTFSEFQFGMTCFKAAFMLNVEGGKNPSQIISLSNRALKTLEANEISDVDFDANIVTIYILLGSANFSLQKFDECLGYYGRACSELSRLKKEGMGSELYRNHYYKLNLEYSKVNKGMGRIDEYLMNMKNCLEITVARLGQDHTGVGYENLLLADAYVDAYRFKEALPFCLKAAEIHEKHLGWDSGVVLRERELLSSIYTELYEYQKALEQKELIQKVLKNKGQSEELIRAEIGAGEINIWMKKYDEGVQILKSAMKKMDKVSEIRALAYISMANAFNKMERKVDANRCLKNANEILDIKEIDKSSEVGKAYTKLGMMYDDMHEYEAAISSLNKALAIFKKIQPVPLCEIHISARLGKILLKNARVREAISILEATAGKMKQSLGPKHFALGLVYKYLGAAYLMIKAPNSAVEAFASMKDSVDADTIAACQNISNVYANLQSYDIAITSQQKVVDECLSRGPEARVELREARKLLKDLHDKLGVAFSAFYHSVLDFMR